MNKPTIPVEKNKIYNMFIDDLGSEGQGIGRIDGFAIFVENVLPNEYIKVLIVKVKKNYGYGKLLEIIEHSEDRVKPFCENFLKCGGCQLQHISYSKQLEFKKKLVENSITRIGKIEGINVLDTIGMENPLYYRNKAQFPVGKSKSGFDIGFYLKRSHNIINTDCCYIQNKLNIEIIKILRDFMNLYNIKPYDETTHTGIIRHIITKIGFTTGEVMVCVVCNSKNLPYSDKFVEMFRNIKGIKSILLNQNLKETNVILGEKVTVLWGRDYIFDYIDNLKFKISLKSFFQINPIQTEILYKKAVELANIKGDETVLDIYCGIGTISLFFAREVKNVIGIEIIPEAIEDAKENARINNLQNIRFEVGKAEEVIPYLYENENIYADIIIVDPPRKGCDEKLINTIIDMKPKTLIYISCNPVTLARDLNILSNNGFKIREIQPIDQFIFTTHVETIVLMQRKNSN